MKQATNLGSSSAPFLLLRVFVVRSRQSACAVDLARRKIYTCETALALTSSGLVVSNKEWISFGKARTALLCAVEFGIEECGIESIDVTMVF